MSSAASPAPRGDPLDVRVRLVVAADGTETRHATVYCPLQERSKTLEDCTQCERCAGLYFEPDQHRSRVLCGWSPDHGLPTRVLPQHWRAGDDASTTTPISAVMGREVLCVRPETRLDTLTALLLDRSIGGVPVVDEEGRPVGVVSKTDLLKSARDDGETRQIDRNPGEDAWGYESGLEPGLHAERVVTRTVAEIMTPIAFALDEDASVAHAAALMAFEGVHRLPVVSTNREVVGVLSSLDILRWIAQRTGYLVPSETQAQRR